MVAAGVSLGLNLLLIPLLGMYGAAISTVAGYGLLAVLAGWQSQRLYPVPWQLGRAIAILGLAVALSALALLGPISCCGGSERPALPADPHRHGNRAPDPGPSAAPGPPAPMSADRPIALLTRIWPTRERPSVGTFVRDRAMAWPACGRLAAGAEGVHLAALLLDALRLGPIRGVEAHMLVPTGLVGLIVARLRGVPLVVYFHGGTSAAGDGGGPPPLAGAHGRASGPIGSTNSEDTAAHLRSSAAVR